MAILTIWNLCSYYSLYPFIETVQVTRPPPLLHKSLQQNSNSGGGYKTSPSSATTTISLESILRQQRPTNTMPRLQAKTASSLVIGNKLKIKPNHIIPSASSETSPQRQKGQFQKLQMAPSQIKSTKFLNQQQHQSNNSSSPQSNNQMFNNSRVQSKQARSSNNNNNFHYQQASSSQLNSSSSARTNGISSATQSLLNTNRLSIASIQQQVQQQQRNALQLQQQQQTKPQKNVPRCPICKRTFATNQVLQRHMVSLKNNYGWHNSVC